MAFIERLLRVEGRKTDSKGQIMNLSDKAKHQPRRASFARSLVAGTLTISLAACASAPGPSVPEQPGGNLLAARAALASCAPEAPDGGRSAVAGSYFAGILLGGIIVGPIVVASNQRNIRANGEARAVDRCLAEQGYVRRDLTEEEVRALNASDRSRRAVILDHLIGGGSLETLGLS